MVIPRNLIAVAAFVVATTALASAMPDPQGVVSVYRSGNGAATGATYSSGSGGRGGFVGSAVHGSGPGFVGTSVRSGGGGGPGQVYVYRSGIPSSTRYYNTRTSPGVTFHRFGSAFPRTAVFDGFNGIGVSTGFGPGFGTGFGTGAYAGGGTGAAAGAGGAFASAGGLGVWAGK